MQPTKSRHLVIVFAVTLAILSYIDRVAISLEGTRVEWRASRCDTSHFVYAVTLS